MTADDRLRDLGPLETGDRLVDAQHRHLFDLADRVRVLQDGSTQQSDIEDILFQLTRYSSTHFTDEESLMRRTGYPDLERHHALHASFSKEIGELMYGYITQSEIDAEQIADLLTRWLSDHVQNEDMKMVEYVRSR